MHGKEHGEEPGSESIGIAKFRELLVRTTERLLVEVVAVVHGSAQPPGGGHGLEMEGLQEFQDPRPARFLILARHPLLP